MGKGGNHGHFQAALLIIYNYWTRLQSLIVFWACNSNNLQIETNVIIENNRAN